LSGNGPTRLLKKTLPPALLGLGLIFCAAAAWAQAGAAGKLVHLRGRVEAFSARERAWQAASSGLFLAPGDAVRTGADGWAAVLMADESLIQVSRNSHLVLKEVAATAGWYQKTPVLPAGLSQKRSVYRIESGEIWLRNKNPAANLELQTPTVSAAVRGTELDLVVAPDATVVLTVLEGLVGAWNDQGAVAAAAGEQVIARPGQPLVKRLLLSPEDAVQWTIPVPPLLDYRDVPLISSDARFLEQERTRLEAALAGRPGDLELKLRLAQVCRDQGRPERAAELFEEILRRRPGSGPALTGLGFTRLDRGRPQEALKAFEAARPPEPMTWLGRAAALAQLGQPDQAARVIEEGQRVRPGVVLLDIQAAYLDLTSGRIKAAQEILARTAEARPEQGLAWGLLALSRLVLNQKTEALKAAERAIQASPGSPTLWLIKAYALQAAFDLEAALAATDQVLELRPDFVLALVNRARLLFGMDYAARAWRAVEAARRLASEDAEVQNLSGFLLLARGQTGEAAAVFSRAAELDPGLGEPRLGLALAHMRRGLVDPALEEMSAAVLLEPRRALFLSYWGKMLYQVRRLDRAMDVLEMARRLDPNDPTPELYQAIILRDKNRPAEAIQAMNRAVALNDNRAVYRSRFLLDKDLAVKNVALSILYDQLGLQAWAFNKATASIKSDYMNSAGHLFLAGTLFDLEGRDRAAESESLLARLLEPANLNSFNQFNEYTSLFEAPSLNGTFTGTVGNLRTHEAKVTADGALPAANLAFRAEAAYDETEGWRETNYGRSSQVEARLKWDPSPVHSFMFSGSHLNTKQGDNFYPRYEYDDPADPFDWIKTLANRLELGYRCHLKPRTDLLFVLTYYEATGDWDQHDQTGPVDFGLGETYIHSFQSVSTREPYYQAQAQLQFQVREHQFVLGTIQYMGSHQISNFQEVYLDLGLPQAIWFGEFETDYDLDKGFHSYYLQDTWKLSPSLTVEAAVYYDLIQATSAFLGTEWNLAELGPRLGLIWTPTRRDTFRLAAFRYLLPFYTSRIDPMDVAGVTIFRNHMEASLAQEADLVWEREWPSGLFWANLFSVKREYNYRVRTDDGTVKVSEKGRMSGLELALNQLLWPGLGLEARYRYLDVEDEGLPSADRWDHQASLGLSWVDPSGFSARLRQTFRHQDLKSEGRPDESIWLTDARIAYELPGKRGKISLEARNIFDQKFNWMTDYFVTTGRVPGQELLLTVSLTF